MHADVKFKLIIQQIKDLYSIQEKKEKKRKGQDSYTGVACIDNTFNVVGNRNRQARSDSSIQIASESIISLNKPDFGTADARGMWIIWTKYMGVFVNCAVAEVVAA